MVVGIQALGATNRCYFDHNATTPVSAEVLGAYLSALRSPAGNPSSIHAWGQTARRILDEARARVADLVGCLPEEIVFLSGGTEADNLALSGVVGAHSAERRHVVTSTVEHPGVLKTCAHLETQGVEVTYLPVDGMGLVDPDELRRNIRPHTVLVSIMHANNETGVIQPVEEFARIARQAGVPFHSDGVQAAGKIPVDVTASEFDLYSLSGHKFYAPKGIGALFVRRDLGVQPLLFGGRQERGMRAGTENVAGAVALGEAARWAKVNMAAEAARLETLRDRLEQGILERVQGSFVNGKGARRLPNTTNIRIAGVEGEAVVIALDLKGFAVSTGAACSSGAMQPSHVLTAMGLKRAEGRSAVRISLGRSNTVEQVDALIEAVAASAARLQGLAPSDIDEDDD